MLAIRKSKQSQGSCSPNILPCQINHNGRVNASKRYWNPSTTIDGKKIAHFRGRKLLATTVKIPENYIGAVILSTKRTLPMDSSATRPGNVDVMEEEEDDNEPAEEVRIMEECANFDDILVWGHETLPDEATDPYIKSVEEWISFAEKLHSYPPPDSKSS